MTITDLRFQDQDARLQFEDLGDLIGVRIDPHCGYLYVLTADEAETLATYLTHFIGNQN